MATAQIIRPSSSSSSAPPYTPIAHELTTFSTTASASASASSASSSTTDLPPSYSDISPDATADPFTSPLSKTHKPFTPTQKLRIDCIGHPALSLPTPPRPDPIPIYDITHDPQITRFTEPLYTSVREARSSGSCRLVPGSDLSAAPLASTTYRFGPGKPPIITLHNSDENLGQEEEEGSEEEVDESNPNSIAIKSKSALHRTLIFRSPTLGTFTWRYASRAERKQTGANSLVILERILPVAEAGSSKPTETVVAEVARFVRSDETRTPGTTRHTAGNGGVLLLDLASWRDTKRGEEEEMRRLAVASCVCVMKKEVDRRRMQQMVTIAAVVGGS